MLSDEEKKAIEVIKGLAVYYDDYSLLDEEEIEENEEVNNSINIVINLIEKKSKEMEELKYKYSDEKIRNTIIKRYREVIEKDYVSKDKIKAKIEELEKQDRESKISHNYLVIPVLQSLLEKE